MTSLKDFIKQKNNNQNNHANQEINMDKIKEENPKNIENLEENIKKYQNMSQQDLMSELFKEAGRLKENGSLNENTLNSLKSTLIPMLNDEQKSMLNNILNQLK